MITSLLVVCTGNICRSPLGAAWFRHEMPGVKVASAGLGALVGQPADPHAVAVAEVNGVDLADHRARQITLEMIHDADLVLTMEQAQRDQILKIAPWSTGKVWRIGHHARQDVHDPYQRGHQAFEIAYHAISSLGRDWLPLAKDA